MREAPPAREKCLWVRVKREREKKQQDVPWGFTVLNQINSNKNKVCESCCGRKQFSTKKILGDAGPKTRLRGVVPYCSIQCVDKSTDP